MTVSNINPQVDYLGNGSTKDFSIPFEFYDPTDPQVRLYPDLTNDPDTYTILAYGVDYTVTGGDGAGGAINIGTAPAAGVTVRITLAMSLGQIVVYQKHGPFPAEAHERALDRLASQIKMVANAAGVAGGTPPESVSSVFGRSGDVVALQEDYIAYYSLLGHTHAWSELTGVPTTFPPTSHTHPWGEITGKPSTFTPAAHQHPWGDITGKPATFAPAYHTHLEADITDLDVYSKAEVDALFSTVTRPKLDELTDVTCPLPVSGDVLTWDSTLQAWKNAQPSGGGTGGAVDSVFGRSGNVVAQTGDYSWSQIASKPTTFAPSAHTHPISDVTGLQTELDSKSDVGHTHSYDQITSKPTEYPPEAHTHTISEVQNLQSSLDGKANTTHSHAINDVTGLQTALDGKQAIGVYAGVTAVASSREIANSDLGKLLVASADVTLTINAETMAVGSRVDLIASGGKITLAIGGTKTILSLGSKLGVTTAGGAATLTKLSSTQWHLGGSLE